MPKFWWSFCVPGPPGNSEQLGAWSREITFRMATVIPLHLDKQRTIRRCFPLKLAWQIPANTWFSFFSAWQLYDTITYDPNSVGMCCQLKSWSGRESELQPSWCPMPCSEAAISRAPTTRQLVSLLSSIIFDSFSDQAVVSCVLSSNDTRATSVM